MTFGVMEGIIAAVVAAVLAAGAWAVKIIIRQGVDVGRAEDKTAEAKETIKRQGVDHDIVQETHREVSNLPDGDKLRKLREWSSARFKR